MQLQPLYRLQASIVFSVNSGFVNTLTIKPQSMCVRFLWYCSLVCMSGAGGVCMFMCRYSNRSANICLGDMSQNDSTFSTLQLCVQPSIIIMKFQWKQRVSFPFNVVIILEILGLFCISALCARLSIRYRRVTNWNIFLSLCSCHSTILKSRVC